MTTEAIAAAADDTAAALETVTADLATARSFNDPDLKPHAVAERREALAAEARTKASEAIASAAARVESAAVNAAKALEASRPRIADNDPAALIRSEQRWTHDVRPLLDAGMPIKAILRDADMDQILAIERFAPGYLRAAQLKAGPDNPLELGAEDLAAAVANRLVAVLPEEQRAAFEDSIRATAAANRFRQVLGMADDLLAGRAEHDFTARAHARNLAIQLRD